MLENFRNITKAGGDVLGKTAFKFKGFLAN